MPAQIVNTRDEYKHFLAIPTRWMDNDVYGHINNVNYYSFFDTAINQYLIKEGGLDIVRGAVIGLAAETHCQFLNSISFPEIVEVGLRVGKLGNSSVRYNLGIFRQGDEKAAAIGWFIHVFVDRETRRATAMPLQLRRALEHLLFTPPPCHDSHPPPA
jgi:acyl-CoA thioester hydrolase